MRKTIKKISLFMVLFGGMAFYNPVVSAQGAKEGIVRGSYINLRAEPNFSSEIIGKKLRGDTYKIVFEQQNWLKVTFKDKTEGWIYKTLVEVAAPVGADPDKEKLGKKEAATEGKASKELSTAQKADSKTASKKRNFEKKPGKSETPLLAPIDKKKLPEVVESSETAEELYNAAIKLYENRKYAEALDKNNAALKRAPRNAEILNNLGNCQFKLGRIEDALNSWKEALKLTPRSGKICNNLGIAYYQLDKSKDAIEYYKKAILLEPDFADPYYNLASVYGFTGEFEESIKYYKKYLEFNPDDTMRRLADERIGYCQKQLKK